MTTTPSRRRRLDASTALEARRGLRTLVTSAALALGLCSTACELGLTDAPCPCATGYVCCVTLAVCVNDPAQCPAAEEGPAATLAVESCADLLAARLGSDLYEVRGASGQRHLAFCDAMTGSELCSEQVEEHSGVTHDDSHLPFQLTSVLEGDQCRVWNVRARADQRPLDALEIYDDNDQFVSVDPCLPLGFFQASGFARSNGCPYGEDPGYGTCGFDSVEGNENGLMKWSNSCPRCRVNPGLQPYFRLQGEIYVSTIPWDASGAYSASCAARPR